LSENGTVTRGICIENKEGYLTKVIETKGIIVDKDGKLNCDTRESRDIIHPDNRVSMNMWAGYPNFIDYLEEGFKEFLLDDTDNPITKEYLLPIIVDQLLQAKRASVKVLQTTDRWFGVTYPEDKKAVEIAMKQLIDNHVYPEKLWK
ncbi:MAG: nucleotidyltransferase, partial [Faecalibacillus sp.]